MIRNNSKIIKEYGHKWKQVKKIFSKIYTSDFLIDQKKYYKKVLSKQKKKLIKSNIYFYDNKICSYDINKVYQIRYDYINLLILKEIIKFDEIVDLGSGYGERMLMLKPLLKPGTKVYLGEFTKSGIQAQKYLIKKYKFKNITSFLFDYNDLEKKYSFKLKNPIFTTFQSIEQITKLKEDFLKNLKKKFKIKRIYFLHLEPVGFQLNKNDKFDKISKKYNIRNAYNQNLISLIKKCSVKNFKIEKDIYTIVDKNNVIKKSCLSLITYNF